MPVPGLVPHLTGNVLTIAYEANADNVDLHADLGEPDYTVNVSVLVADGVTIGAALNPGQFGPGPALFVSGFAAGSTVHIINRGTILGGGGIGGGGDRGRRDTATANTFVGGGGGGGAGSSSQGGPHAVAGGTSATDGAAGTTTTGGAAGDNETSGSGSGGYTLGAAAQTGGTAIQARNVNLVIHNMSGEIISGGAGGEGGYQDGGLPGGEVLSEAGESVPTSVTFITAPISGAAYAVSHVNAFGASGNTLTWIGGDTYPSVAGYVLEVA